jgi:hypothetical protein
LAGKSEAVVFSLVLSADAESRRGQFHRYDGRKRKPTMPDLVAELAERSRSRPPLSEIEAAWDAEIVRRMAAYERGAAEIFAAVDVFAEARRIAP